MKKMKKKMKRLKICLPGWPNYEVDKLFHGGDSKL